MKNPRIPPSPNATLLKQAFDNIAKAGMDEAVAAYIVLSSEYLFRFREIDAEEENKVLLEIENGLKKNFSSRATYHLVNALESFIRRSVQETESRELIAFEKFRTRAFSDMNPVQRSVWYFETRLDNPTDQRLPLERFAPVKPGPPPWISPWVAGCAIHQHFLDKNISKVALLLDLVGALFDKKAVTDDEFRKKYRTLKGADLTAYCESCKSQYETMLRNETLIAPGYKVTPRTWEHLILNEQKPGAPNTRRYDPGKREIHFYENIATVQNLIKTYGKPPQKKQVTQRPLTSSKNVSLNKVSRTKGRKP